MHDGTRAGTGSQPSRFFKETRTAQPALKAPSRPGLVLEAREGCDDDDLL